MELYPGVYQIQSVFGGRNLFQYLFVGDNVVLIDTGTAETPERVIFPYLNQLRLRPDQLTLAVTTHADLDHQGGNDAIKRASSRTWLACGEADRAMVEDPQALFDLRYNHLLKDHGVGTGVESLPLAGKIRHMDVSFAGGERIRLTDGWDLEVLHVPGHSHGHLSFYDRKDKAAFVGDAIHGRGCPDVEGVLALPVTYYYVDVYLGTLRYLEGLPIDVLYSGHWPVMRGEEIREFIAQSRQTVDLFDRVILRSLEIQQQHAGLSLKQLIDAVATKIADLPKEACNFAMFAVKGHMDRLEQMGRVKTVSGAKPVKWQLV